MNQRSIIAVILILLGIAIYLLTSESSVRVQLLTVLEQLLFLLTISCIAWASSFKRGPRLLALLMVVIIGSAVTTYLDSFFIKALIPLHPLHFASRIVGFFVEALLFLGGAWLIDRAIMSIRTKQE